MDKSKIRYRFSRSARTYEDFDAVQRYVVENLFRGILKEGGIKEGSLLDIGAGTGRMLQRIKGAFPKANLFGLDISEGMLEQAAEKGALSGTPLFQADAERLPFQDGLFDFVVSNSTYQWVADLSCALSEAKRVLKDKGKIFFSLFGRDTLKELIFCIREVEPDAYFYPLPHMYEVRAVLEQLDFKDIDLTTDAYIHKYRDIKDALAQLKYTGTSYRGTNVFKGLGGRAFIKQLQDIYSRNFHGNGEFTMTYEAVMVKAKK